MDYEHVAKLDEQHRWLLEKLDLQQFNESRSIPITLDGETRQIDVGVIQWVFETISKITSGGYGAEDIFNFLSGSLFNNYSKPEGLTFGMDGTWAYLKEYTLVVVDDKATLEVVWGITKGAPLKDKTKQEHYDDIVVKQSLDNPNIRQRLNAFSVVRGWVKQMYGNHHGMKDFRFRLDVCNQKHEFEFISKE